MEKKEQIYLEILRIIACFMVIINHTNSVIFLNTTPDNVLWFTSLTSFYISKMGVPIFILISGALLLNKDYSYKKILTKVIKFILILVIFSLIFYIYLCLKNNQVFEAKDFLIKLYNQKILTAYWYLYLYICILLMLPLLQKLVKQLKNKDFYFYFIISFLIVGGILLILPHYYNKLVYSTYYLYLFSPYIGLLLLGYFINYRLELKNNKKTKLILISIIILFTLISVLLTYNDYQHNPQNYLFFSERTLCNITIPSISLFILIKLIFEKRKPPKHSNIIKSISKATFIIYLVHYLIVLLTQDLQNKLFELFNMQIAIYAYAIIIFIISYIIAIILLKIPIVKKLFK